MTAKIFQSDNPVKTQPVRRLLFRSMQLFLMIILLSGCREEPIIWDVESTHQVIAQYVTSNPEFSEFAKILESTDLYSLLSVRGPFTLFLPPDEAMQAYYEELGVSSQEDLNMEFLEDLAKNHLVPSRMETNDFGLGALRDLNALGDYLVTEFEGSEIVLNKYSMVIKRNIPAANGVIHHIDQVLEPVTHSVYEQVAGDPSFSLFAEGLERTRLKDTLSVIREDFYGFQKAVDERFKELEKRLEEAHNGEGPPQPIEEANDPRNVSRKIPVKIKKPKFFKVPRDYSKHYLEQRIIQMPIQQMEDPEIPQGH